MNRGNRVVVIVLVLVIVVSLGSCSKKNITIIETVEIVTATLTSTTPALTLLTLS